MKYLNSSVLVASILFSILTGYSPKTNAQSFEGTIRYSMQEMETGEMAEMLYMIKDSKTRIEFGEGQQKGVMLLLPEESKSVVLINQMKGYITMDQDLFETPRNQNTDFKLDKTGETKSIAGHSCEVWIIENEEETFNVCMAKDLGSFMMPENPMGNSRNIPNWAKEAIAEGVMPLEVVRTSDDQENIQMQATSISRKSLDSSLFEIPADYKDMSGMLKQMMKGNGN